MAGQTKSLKWYGKAITAKMEKAQVEGVNKTMAACVIHAKQNHPWQNRTGLLEGAIDIASYAASHDQGVKGTWGVRDMAQARILEEGGTIRPVRAKALAIPQADGSVRFASSVTIPAHPYLRPAADHEYVRLGERIRKAFERAGTAS
ncbi:phage morphogenesis protein [Devosia sp.]|uniref:phage morphogenesis protein n=1 Tax=Devosia sp. TaxID=1871048 RepID=UPI001AC83E4B|nr:phage morphogenesis protein [Devosia sp.]MBN9333863.1 phage morphogenesis protein [Devosia sp.]